MKILSLRTETIRRLTSSPQAPSSRETYIDSGSMDPTCKERFRAASERHGCRERVAHPREQGFELDDDLTEF